LFDYIQKDEWFNKEIERISVHYNKWTDQGRIDHTPIQGMEIHGWNLIHSTVINLHSENKHKHVFDLIERFLSENYAIDAELKKELLEFQKLYLIDYNKIGAYPVLKTLQYDIPSYVQDDSVLTKNNCVYEFDFPEDKTQSLQRFCEQIFFARRRNFGKAWITKK
jgi:hypothetical protein